MRGLHGATGTDVIYVLSWMWTCGHYCVPLCVSGLNLQSQFNLDNIIVFNKNKQESTLGQKVRPCSKDYRYCVLCKLLNDVCAVECA